MQTITITDKETGKVYNVPDGLLDFSIVTGFKSYPNKPYCLSYVIYPDGSDQWFLSELYNGNVIKHDRIDRSRFTVSFSDTISREEVAKVLREPVTVSGEDVFRKHLSSLGIDAYLIENIIAFGIEVGSQLLENAASRLSIPLEGGNG